jgi:hypothetical protein
MRPNGTLDINLNKFEISGYISARASSDQRSPVLAPFSARAEGPGSRRANFPILRSRESHGTSSVPRNRSDVIPLIDSNWSLGPHRIPCVGRPGARPLPSPFGGPTRNPERSRRARERRWSRTDKWRDVGETYRLGIRSVTPVDGIRATRALVYNYREVWSQAERQEPRTAVLERFGQTC